MMRRFIASKKFKILVAICVVIICFALAPFDHPAKAACQWGDIVCELQQAGQSLIDSYLTPLKDWFLIKMNALFYGFIYEQIKSFSVKMWDVSKIFIAVGVAIGKIADWISTAMFAPMISQTTAIAQSVFGVFAVIALFTLGMTYMLSSMIRFRVVNPRNALMWFIAVSLFFQFAPSIYQSMFDFRRSINSYFYAAAQDALQGQNPLGDVSADDTSSSGIYKMSTPCNNFPGYNSNSTTLNGLDISLAYLRADGKDVLAGGNPCGPSNLDVTDLPRSWYDEAGYFDAKLAPETWEQPGVTADAAIKNMQQSVQAGFSGISRQFNDIPIILFGIFEQLVSLCLMVAMGLTFVSFAVAGLFALFERTEGIAWSIFDQWVALLIQSVIIGLLQGMMMALYLSATDGANPSPLVAVAVSWIGLMIMGMLLVSALKSIWNSFNRLFESFGQATGAMVTPGGAVSVAAQAGAAVGGAGALASGATWAQAAGVTLGGNRALDGAALQLTRIPGMSNTALGEVANQFVEGSAASRIGQGLIGAVPGAGGALSRLGGAAIGSNLLTDRNRAHEQAYQDEGGSVYWQAPMLHNGMNAGMNNLLSGPKWNDGETSKIGRGGQALTNNDGSPFRRENIGAEQNDLINGWGQSYKGKFTPANGSVGLDNSGNLDETISEDMKRSMAAKPQGGGDAAGNRLEAAAGKLEASAAAAGESLSRAADAQTRAVNAAQAQQKMDQVEGRMSVNGSNNIAEIMGNAINAIQQQNAKTGQVGANNEQTSAAMAGAMGITPVNNSPIERNIARFGMLADQATTMGLDGDTVKNVIREVKSSPDGRMSTQTRHDLTKQQHDRSGQSWTDSMESVRSLENAARVLPGEVSAYGLRSMPAAPAPTPIIFTPSGSGGQPAQNAPVVFNTPARPVEPAAPMTFTRPDPAPVTAASNNGAGDMPLKTSTPPVRQYQSGNAGGGDMEFKNMTPRVLKYRSGGAGGGDMPFKDITPRVLKYRANSNSRTQL